MLQTLITFFCFLITALQTERVLHTYTDHPCIRQCTANSPPRECEYDFHLEYYFTLSKACFDCPYNKTDCYRPHCVPADGVPRGILVVNRMLPGPAIHVCEGDTIVVNVYNLLTGAEGATIHWHGIFQRDYQFMDGVPMITQCPIPAYTSFQYRFVAANSGTHVWHAHSGLQRADGIFGALVVRQSQDREAHLGLYEEDLPEHTMVVHDWLVELTVNRFAHHHHAGGDNKPKSMLINGKGILQEYFDNTDNTTRHTPVEVFTVAQGKRYRFRTISNGLFYCPIQISIDSHNLSMIASDGNPFERLDVESFIIYAGERFDFVVNASMSVGNYWVRARGLGDCGNKHASQVAILRYMGAPEEDPAGDISYRSAKRSGKTLNPLNIKGTEEQMQISDLKARKPVDHDSMALKERPDKKFYVAFDFYKINNYHFHDRLYYPISGVDKSQHIYMPQINHISNILPHAPPLTQLEDLEKETFCNGRTTALRNCSEEFCECTHLLQVDLGDVVEIILIDEGVIYNANHPFHLHGYKFYVVGMDRLNESTSLEEVMTLDAEGKLPRQLTDPVAKDTVTVPDGGYTILRLHATNPGFWFFHCHIEFHVDDGMGLILQVGNYSQMPKAPKNFPKCGNWKFEGYDSSKEMDDNSKPVSGTRKRTNWVMVLITTFAYITAQLTYIP